MKENILIIENQQSDFEKISKSLKDAGFNVFPIMEPDKEGPDEAKDLGFTEVTDLVRIFLNSQYEQPRKRKASSELTAFCKRNKIDIMVVDYKLSGNSLGETGVDLVLELTSPENLGNIPYLFLTRTPKNLDSVRKKVADLGKEPIWVDKGFGGFRIFDKNYFYEYVIKKIKTIIPQSTVENSLDKLNSFIKQDILPSDRTELLALRDRIVKNSFIIEFEKEFIDQLDKQPWQIQQALKQLKAKIATGKLSKPM